MSACCALACVRAPASSEDVVYCKVNEFSREVVETGFEVVENDAEVVENPREVVEKDPKVVEKYLEVVDPLPYLQCFHRAMFITGFQLLSQPKW